MPRRQLNPNPSLELDAAGYRVGYVRSGITTSPSLGSAPLRADTVAAAAGSWYGYVNITGGAAHATLSDVDIVLPTFDVEAGKSYGVSLADRFTTIGLQRVIYLKWLNASGGTISTTQSAKAAVDTSEWPRAGYLAVAPAGAVRCEPQLWLYGATDSTTSRSYRFDAVLYEQTAAPGAYFDGDTATASWDGAAHASTSTLPDPTRTRPVGQPVETDTATAVGRRHRRGIGQAAETDSVAAVGRVRVRVPRSGERDSVTPLERLRVREITAPAAEVDTAVGPGRARRRAPGQPRETDTVAAIAARSRRRVMGQPREDDTPTPVARRHRRGVGQVVSYDVVTQLAQSSGAVSPAAFDAAVRSPDRVTYGTLVVDWTGDGTFAGEASDLYPLADSIEVERERRGDLPDVSGLIDGPVSSSLKLDLGGYRHGAAMPFAEELSPFRPDSPLAGTRKTLRAIRAELGLVTGDGPKAERVFTGLTRDFTIGEGDASVQLEGIDPSENLRALVTLPTFAEFVTHVAERGRGVPANGWQFTVNTQWLLDFCLRQNGIYSSPPPRPNAIISCTGHGGLVSERGFNGAPVSRASAATRPRRKWTEDANPFGMLATPEGSAGSYQEFFGYTDTTNPPVRFSSGQGVGVSGWLHLSSQVGGSSSSEYILWQLWPTYSREPRLFVHAFGDGTIAAGLYDQNAYKIITPRVPLTAAPWHFVGVHFRWIDNDTLGVTIRTRAKNATGGTTRTFSLAEARVTVTPTPYYDGYRAILLARAHMWRAWQLLQVWPGFTPPSTSSATAWHGEQWTPQADIARGNNELAYLPNVAAAETWATMKAAVAAEYGVHGFDDFGRYSFRPRTDARPDRVDHVLDVATNLGDVRYSISSDAVRNSVGLETNPKWHAGKLTAVVKTDSVDQFIVPGNSTRQWDLDWPFGAAGYRGGTLPYHHQEGADPANGFIAGFDKWTSDVAHGWTYSSIGASGNYTIKDNNRSVILTYCQIDSRRVRVRIQNTAAGSIRIASAATVDDPDAGEPALRIGGWPLIDVPAKVTTFRNEVSIDALGGQQGGGERSLPIPSSEWRQNEEALTPVMRALLEALAEERPLIEDLEVRGDPRIKVDGVAELWFRDVPRPAYGTVVKTRHSLSSNGGLRTQVSVRLLPVARQPVVDPGDTLAPPGWTFYIDISRYQEGIDLAQVREQGYAGCVAKVGQGAGSGTDSGGASVSYGETIDPQWTTFRDAGRALWPSAFAGYWYVGNVETPASQAARCKAALGDTTIPVMLDWELTGGDWSNLLNVLAAFRSAGIRTTMLYTNMQGYAVEQGASNIDSATGGLALVNSRYWIRKETNPAQDPRAVFDDILVSRPGFGFGTVLGGSIDALQFTDAGVVYPGGPAIDVNAFPGDAAQLATMINGS